MHGELIVVFRIHDNEVDVVLFDQLLVIGQSMPQLDDFVDNEVTRVVKTREEAKVYHVALEAGQVVETELPAEMIS